MESIRGRLRAAARTERHWHGVGRLWANYCQTGTKYEWRPDSFYALNSDTATITRPNHWTSSGQRQLEGSSNEQGWSSFYAPEAGGFIP